MQENQNINDEIIITQCLQMFKNMIMNIFIFILCIFLFLNPVLLVNVLLFISIYLFIRSSLTYFSEDNIPTSQFETEIKINFDESELLKDRIRQLKKENTILKDRIDRTDRKHKKREKVPLFQSSQPTKPFKINVEFPEIDTESVEIKKETEKEVVEKKEDEIKKETEKEVEKKEDDVKDTIHEIDFDKIISDVINEIINNSDSLKDDGFAILSKTPNNSEEHSSEEDSDEQ